MSTSTTFLSTTTKSTKSHSSIVRRMERVLSARIRTARFMRRVTVESAPELLTVGDLNYGGYQLPVDLLDEDSVVLSAGAGTDVSFESMVVDRYGCRVHVIDPVAESAAHVLAAMAHEPRVTFEQVALWNRDTRLPFHAPELEGFVSHSATNMHDTPVSFEAEAHTVGSLRARHGWDRIDLLKISTEGSEFAILETILSVDEPIKAICVEFAQPVKVYRVEDAVAKLRSAGYMAVARSGRPFNWKMTFVRA